MKTTLPWSVFGLRVKGDIGPFTLYTDRFGRKTAFPISPPKEPPTAAQLRQRDRFRQSHSQWKQLTTIQKANLEEACRRASLCLTGKNLFMSACLLNKDASLQAIGRQTNLELPHAVYIP